MNQQVDNAIGGYEEMTLEKCIDVLTKHNQWRRGDVPYEKSGELFPYSPREIGLAIDYAIEELHRLKGLEK